MAFVAANLEKIGGGGRQLFIYHAGADSAATAAGSGHMNAVAGQLRQGDVILIIGTGGTLIDPAVVTSATGATPVTVAVAET